MSTQTIRNISPRIVELFSEYMFLRTLLFVVFLILAKTQLPSDLGALWLILSVVAAALAFKDEQLGFGAATYILVLLLSMGGINGWSTGLIYLTVVCSICLYIAYYIRQKNIYLGIFIAIVLACSTPLLTHVLADLIPLGTGIDLNKLFLNRGW